MKEEAATLKLQVKRVSDDKDQLHALHDRVQRELLAETNALQGKLEDAVVDAQRKDEQQRRWQQQQMWCWNGTIAQGLFIRATWSLKSVWPVRIQ